MQKKNLIIILVAIAIVVGLIFLFVFLKDDEKEIRLEDYTQVYMYNLDSSNIEIIKKDDIVILVNTGLGEDREDLIDELNKLEIQHINYLIITNKDDRYIGNVNYLLDNYLVDYIYMNDYDYSSSLMSEVESSLVGSYTENIILTSNEVISLDDLIINIYPYMQEDSSMNDKTLIVEIIEGDNSIYLTSNASNKRLGFINKSTLIVSENNNLFDVNSKYYLLDGESNLKSKTRDLKIYFNEKEFIIE